MDQEKLIAKKSSRKIELSFSAMLTKPITQDYFFKEDCTNITVRVTVMDGILGSLFLSP